MEREPSAPAGNRSRIFMTVAEFLIEHASFLIGL